MMTKDKADNQGKDLVKSIKAKQKEQKMNKVKQFPFIQALKGIWLFAEGVALLVTSLYAIYQARYENLPQWGAYALTVSGVLVLVPATVMLAKYFRKLGQ
jgi:hypothetical protein